jgi:hypothetical protein
MKYKNKICVICGIEFTPTGSKQKFCINCKTEGDKLSNRIRDKKRSRVNNGYKEYTRNCLACGKEFTTYYKKKLYCGNEECDKERIRRKNYITNTRRDKLLESLRYKDYYERNVDLCRHKKALKYRESTGSTTPYINRVYKRSYEFVKEYVTQYGYTLITNKDFYKNTHSKILLLCPEGHTWETTFHGFRDVGDTRGARCIHCYTSNNYTSRPEQKLVDYFKTNYPNINLIHNDRTQISPLELDLYFPSHSLGIEVCGLYWHSEVSGGKNRSYHYDKMIKCADKNIRLITIFEDEIRDKFDIVVSRILVALGIIKNKVFARKCVLSEISVGVANSFFKENHIQGASTALKAWGLYYNGELVAACSVGNVGRKHAGGSNMVELKRFCSKLNLIIVGGFSKLFKLVIDYYKGYIIKSYCDMRYGNIFNPVYELSGFTLLGSTKYTPHYIKNGKRFRNFSLRKTPEERLTGKTEFELRLSQGYDRIWDCGHRTYVYGL